MSRPKQFRKIGSPPLMRGFKPFGIRLVDNENVIMQYDEYEAVKLLDYEGMLQEQAAERMNISRPTLTRIYDSARKKIALAMVEGKTILIKGGKVDFGKKWYRCKNCFKLINGLENHKKCNNCSFYGDNELLPIN
ncbi:MAG TPA: DUF134 domain-containing protein [Bacteroidaceae bacterium]|nr:DUF134 domain-containing protein [Bacteroidaceae bacterium]